MTITVLFLLVGLFACGGDPRVVIQTRAGKDVAFEVEIADTPAKREMGFQYRRELADDHGMIFVFPSESVLTFWMKNTPIPLDMIFIGGDLKIVGIVREAVPFTLSARSVDEPSRYVLEIKGGLARQRGIEVGDRLRFEGVPENVRE
ncbi:MAG TPA: DUF192 domain-containing protein [Verrucomicrobiae bacterium]|nr:DUF192 domain-containing protein [Verrucomicrobiae bacterium]